LFTFCSAQGQGQEIEEKQKFKKRKYFVYRIKRRLDKIYLFMKITPILINKKFIWHTTIVTLKSQTRIILFSKKCRRYDALNQLATFSEIFVYF